MIRRKPTIGKRTAIEVDDVARGGGIDKEYNVFELTKSVGKRDLRQSLRIVNYFARNPKDNPFVLVLINLYNYFKKIHLIHFEKSANTNGNREIHWDEPVFCKRIYSCRKKLSTSKNERSICHSARIRFEK